jgi:hypothetical protein
MNRRINGIAPALALTVAVAMALVTSLITLPVTTPAAAQTVEFKQMKLNEKQVQGFISAQKDLAAIAPKLQAAGDKPDAALMGELEAIAKKSGFATFAEFDDVAANISMVMAGLDPQNGEYTDPVEVIKKEIADIEKDASIPEKDKKLMMDELKEALKTTPPLQFKDNITLVKKFQKEIEQSLQ